MAKANSPNNDRAIGSHWTFNPYTQYNMTLTGVLHLDGASMQNAPKTQHLEIGAFCGNECRGSYMATEYSVPIFQGYVYFMQIYSEIQDGEEITFRIWDHQTNEELDVNCISSINFSSDASMGNLTNPYALSFQTNHHITVEANPTQGGMVTGAGSYIHGTTCTLTATAGDAYDFVNWTKNGSEVSTETIYTFTVNESADYVANFEMKTYHITATTTPAQAGTVTGAGTYIHGTTCTLTAQPNTGYAFVNWMENDTVVSTENTISFTAYHDRTFVANFEAIMHHVNVTANIDAAGTVSGGGDYQEGTLATVSAQPNANFDFVRWSENGASVSTNRNYSFTVWNPRNLMAEFEMQITDTAAFACEEFTWHGHTYTSNGIYYDTLTSYLGIDSIVALNLTIYPSYHYEYTETECGNYFWEDSLYTESGDYTREYQSIYGCDSILTLHLTILPIRPLGNFTYMSPANNYIDRYTDMDFYWDAIPNADRYDFYFWEGEGGKPNTPTLANTTSHSYHVDGLTHGGEYHWCVVAKNECQESESATRTFTCQLNPAMSVVPNGWYDFGEVEVGQTRTRTISVSGTALTEDISYTYLDNAWGNDAEFFEITSSNWNTLSGGLLHVTFAPAATQLYYNAGIRIASGAFVDTLYFTGSVANRYVFTTNVDGDVFSANDEILITGHVEDILGNPASDLGVSVYLIVMGSRTTGTAVSDANGNYSTTYTPRYSESGFYQVGSCAYGTYSNEVHDSFDIPGMSRVSNNFIIWEPYQDETLTGTVEIRNRSRIPISNIQVNTVSLPNGCSVSFTGVTSLGPLETGTLNYVVTGSQVTTGNNYYDEALFQVTADNGLTMNMTCYYHCRERRGALAVYPPSIATTMKRYNQKALSFQITNNGNGETGPITIGLPDVEWMSLLGSNTLESLPVGDSCAFSVLLAPDENVSLNQYSGSIAVNCDNGNGISIPYLIEATSDSTGVLRVDVTDDNTYNGNGDHLAGANVYVKGYYSLEMVAQGVTDENGLFIVENLPEGYYYLTIHATQHSNYEEGIILIEGGKTNHQNIYLQYQAISYSWVVTPTEIEDVYEFELVAEIHTNVPAPVVTVDCPSKIDTLAYGDTIQFNLTVTNHGLIDAYETHLTMPTEFPEYDFIPMIDFIDTLHAKTSVVIPCIVTRTQRRTSLSDYHCHLGSGRTISGYYCNQQKEWVEFTFTIGFRVYCNYTGPQNPIVNFPPPTTPTTPPVAPVLPPPSVPTGGFGGGWPGSGGSGSGGSVAPTTGVDNVTTTSQDCTPCWQMFDLPLNRIMLSPELQELMRQSRSCASDLGNSACPVETDSIATEWPLWTQTGDLSKIDPELQELMRDSRDGNETFRVIVEMKEQYDNPNLERGTAMMARAERRDYVVNELKRFSESSQAEVSRYLEAKATRGGVRVLHNFWIFNGVCCEATASCIDELSLRNDVRYVSLDKEIVMDDPMERGSYENDNPPEGVQWHVSRIQADQVWNYPYTIDGYTGKGVVVAIIDSGVNYEHEDISANMWDGGEQFPHHGWDFYNNDKYPMDDNGHGSHVAGIVAGGFTGATYQSGVAPDAKIMALKIANSEGHWRRDDLCSAAQFALEHGADIMNISLGSQKTGGIAAFRKTFVNVLNAGVVVSSTAGNNGSILISPGYSPVPTNINAPGNCPPPWHNPTQEATGGYSAVICVGNTTIDNTTGMDIKEEQSSFGPVTWTEGQFVGNFYQDYPLSEGGLIRPDVSAPGTDIWSIKHNSKSGYVKMSGTSMAAPCVAGVIALMLQANPNLTPVKIDSILETTAVRCEGQQTMTLNDEEWIVKDNNCGAGRVDAYAAVTAAIALNAVMPQRYRITTDQVPFSVCTTVKGGGYYQGGQQCTLKAPAEHFLRWEKDGMDISQDPNYTFAIINDTVNVIFTVTEDAQYVAYFEESIVCYYVEVTANLWEGVSERLMDGYNEEFGNLDGVWYYSYYVNQPCSVSITPNPGYWFLGWIDDYGEIHSSPEYTFTVDRNIKLTAMLMAIPPIPNYGPGTVMQPPTLQDLAEEKALLQSVLDAINSCMSGCNRDASWEENLAGQLGQCRNFYQAILNVYTNLFQEAEWMEEQNIAQFLDNFYAFVDPIYQTVSPQAMQQLIDLSELTSANAATIQSFVERWNRSVQYWNEGVYTLADLPEGYDPNFVQKDGTMLQPAEAACEYATANGFNNFTDMYYSTRSDCSDLFLEHQNDVCAKISVSFKQTMTMTREAFEGTLKIFNGHTTDPMQDINVDIVIKDADGVDRTDLFQVNVTSLSDITGVDGTGTLAAQTEGIAQFVMIPTIEAAPDTTKIYYFGGSFSFLDPFSGNEMTYDLFPVQLKVNPGPNLHVDYFISRHIISDDPLTDSIIEPTEPAELAMMISNVGAGNANNVYLESSQPQIIDNQNGLLINFDMVGAAMNGVPRPLGLTNIPFGTIESHTAGIAEWYFTSTLMARVVHSTPHVIHNTSYGNPNLSLVTELNSHELIKAIRAYGSLEDGINDFFVNETVDFNHTPDMIYFSHGGTSPVSKVIVASTERELTEDNDTILLHINPTSEGWNYACVDDPGEGMREIIGCIRDDGQVIPLSNVWITRVTMPDEGAPIHENKLHIVDTLNVSQTTTYTLIYGESPYSQATQTMQLAEGWNWWSSYLNLSDTGLERVEEGLANHGVIIKSQHNGFVMNDEGDWYGSLQNLDNRYMYRIMTDAETTLSINGTRVNLSQINIEMESGWNWIGYPVAVTQTVSDALSNLAADDGDLLKSQTHFSVYDGEDGWFGGLLHLTPGQGYMYNGEQPHSFQYHNGRTMVGNDIEPDLYWTTNVHAYPDNMSLVATVFVDGEEQRTDHLEVGAFSNGAAVGNAQLLYNAKRDRWFALLPVSGTGGETVTFRLYDSENLAEYASEAKEQLGFTPDAIVGTLDQPLALHFRSTTGISEDASAMLKIYPNPVSRGGEVRLDLPDNAGKTTVQFYNVLNVVVSTKETTGNAISLDTNMVPGTYFLKVSTESGNVYYGKLIIVN